MKLLCLIGQHNYVKSYSRYKIMGDEVWYMLRKKCTRCGTEDIEYIKIPARSMWEFEKEHGIK